MSPDQVTHLIERHGGQRPAGRATGIPQSTLWGWLHPERKRASDLAYYHRRGWSVRRKRDLAAQRARVKRDLRLLEQERERIEGEGC